MAELPEKEKEGNMQPPLTLVPMPGYADAPGQDDTNSALQPKDAPVVEAVIVMETDGTTSLLLEVNGDDTETVKRGSDDPSDDRGKTSKAY